MRTKFLGLLALTWAIAFTALVIGLQIKDAFSAEVDKLNALTNSANFVLGDGEGWCSGTLISVK